MDQQAYLCGQLAEMVRQVRTYRQMMLSNLPGSRERQMAEEWLMVELERLLCTVDTLCAAHNQAASPSATASPPLASPKPAPSPTQPLRQFTSQELAQYDGSSGQPAYVAVNGIVYDVSTNRTWGGGTHFGLVAGRDLSSQFAGCHGGMQEILNRLPVVGVMAP